MDEKGQNNETVRENKPTGSEAKEVNYEEEISTNRELQSFVDKKVSQGISTALEKAKKQWQLEQDTQKTEAEKLAGMTEKQKQEYALKKVEDERDSYKNELDAYKLKNTAVKIATEKGLDASLLDLIDFKNIKAEEVENTIDNLSKVFNTAVENGVKSQLKEKAPISKQDNISNVPIEVPKIF